MLSKTGKSYKDRRQYYEPLYFSTGGTERRKQNEASMMPERRNGYEDRRQVYEPLYFSTGGNERRRNRYDRRLDKRLRDPNWQGD